MLKMAVDVHYDEERDLGRSAGVLFDSWESAEPIAEQVTEHRGLEPYQPGKLFRRELPCLLPLIQRMREQHQVQTIVVDGYVDLGASRPGLGRHLSCALEATVEIIGVAKSPFAGAAAVPVRRGASRRPLWVTSTANAREAAEQVRSMHGGSRIPTLLRRVDLLARGKVEPLAHGSAPVMTRDSP